MLTQDGGRQYRTERYFFDVQYYTNESRKQIEQAADLVVEVTDGICKAVRSLNKPGRDLLREIQNFEQRCPEDIEHKIVSNYLLAEESLIDLRDKMLRKEDAAVCDPRLHGKNEARVTSGYRNAIKAIEKQVLLLQEIRWAVMESAEGLDEIVHEESAEEFLATVG